MSNSAVLFVPAARCCARVCPSLRMCLRFRVRRRAHGGLWRQRPSRQQQFRPPDEGWMERRQAHSSDLGRACDARPPVPVRPGPLSALHRGGFRMRTHEVGSRQWNRSRSDCPRQALTPGGRGPDLPRCGSRRSVGRHSLLRLSGSFLENAPLSQDVNPVSQTRYVVNSKVVCSQINSRGVRAGADVIPRLRRACCSGSASSCADPSSSFSSPSSSHPGHELTHLGAVALDVAQDRRGRRR